MLITFRLNVRDQFGMIRSFLILFALILSRQAYASLIRITFRELTIVPLLKPLIDAAVYFIIRANIYFLLKRTTFSYTPIQSSVMKPYIEFI